MTKTKKMKAFLRDLEKVLNDHNATINTDQYQSIQLEIPSDTIEMGSWFDASDIARAFYN